MALNTINLGGTLFYTPEGGINRLRDSGLLRTFARHWTMPVLVENDTQRAALIALFDGAPVAMTIQDGTVYSAVTVAPTALPMVDDNFVASLTIDEVA